MRSSRALPQRSQKFGRVAEVGDAGTGDRRLNVGVGGAPCANFAANESAQLNLGQRLDREGERLLEHGGRRKCVSRQQELQDLPAAVGKLEVAESPARAENEYVVIRLISDDDLLARARRSKMLHPG